MSWSRRAVLSALGTSAAAAALAACRGGRAVGPRVDEGDLRSALRDAVAMVRARWPAATGWAAVDERLTVLASVDDRATGLAVTATALLRASDGARVVELATGDPTPAAIRALGAELAARGPGGGRTLATTAPKELGDGPTPRRTAAAWLVRLQGVVESAPASDRVVWRAAHAVIDDQRRWHVADGLDVLERRRRLRTGLAALAWSGTRPSLGEVGTAGAGDLDAVELPAERLAAATTQAVESLTPGFVPAGPATVMLDPTVVAALLATGLGELLTAAAWRRPDAAARAWRGAAVAAEALSVRDDPTAGGHGGYAYDDEGWPGEPVPLVERGALAGVLADARGALDGLRRTGHGRRDRRHGPAVARPSDLYVAPGDLDDDALRAAAGTALSIEDAEGAVVDPVSWEVTVRARRARQLARGARTGRVWPDVEVRGRLPELLGAITAVGATCRQLPAFAGDDAPAASVTAPAVLTRATVAPRRRG